MKACRDFVNDPNVVDGADTLRLLSLDALHLLSDADLNDTECSFVMDGV